MVEILLGFDQKNGSYVPTFGPTAIHPTVVSVSVSILLLLSYDANSAVDLPLCPNFEGQPEKIWTMETIVTSARKEIPDQDLTHISELTLWIEILKSGIQLVISFNICPQYYTNWFPFLLHYGKKIVFFEFVASFLAYNNQKIAKNPS
ncbi:hypothetical protein PHYBLDRAFT_71419 [Phycomyces blakesleeanus NRRL 1555(-)]|uniref:Uncharacterized protein n=1 Tax=Phycomyces blakesleeanus (strain ATCC 8743b / DSM 1359 / FGSC 10004 / NBRC 33097 / NRRL 1555) TaxID=763407 RepID=A0A162UDK6_PHYB8|nr:hypothetical protein PHYBLDRAFT_71419 [Phycomyces blakesleeanus NRRL 1555(-)]OAD74313.1 hypothetical protein PHYBLDRAFT_71419 [Phycomyces blakesleeanus NRRL 1555(-)]|eukprot:XP_018292353.1 hypothetical protein PHYBLDRAFT_71419 [Phycomyces blakesleeanus NRRL 1555(-)]